MLYCLKQLELGYGINHYLKTMTFKIKMLLIDAYRKQPICKHSIIIENLYKINEDEDDFIEVEMKDNQVVLFSSLVN
jgi:hypothetical protein